MKKRDSSSISKPNEKVKNADHDVKKRKQKEKAVDNAEIVSAEVPAEAEVKNSIIHNSDFVQCFWSMSLFASHAFL